MSLKHEPASEPLHISVRDLGRDVACRFSPPEKIFMELMTSGRQLKASLEGSK